MPKAGKKEEKKPKKGVVKKVIIATAIAIVFAFFIGYLISAFYESPRYEVYCNDTIMVKTSGYNSSTECETAGGKWSVSYTYDYSNEKIASPSPSGSTGFCDPSYYCSQKLRADEEIYNRNVFFMTSVIGIITLVISFFLTLEFVSNGFLAGAIFLIIYGTIRYWGFMSNKIKAVMLGIVLAILVWIAYKKLRK
jgi:hypothetical protein